MLYTLLEFVGMLGGIALPLMSLNNLRNTGYIEPRLPSKPAFSDYAVDEDGNLVAIVK